MKNLFHVIVIVGLLTGCNQYYDYAKGARCYNEKNYTEAFIYFQKAADSGDSVSQCYLGIMYDLGQGVNQNDLLAIKWYKESAKNGCLPALNNLGRLYVKMKNFKEAAIFFEQAAKKGYLPSVYEMGVLYEDGTGVEKNISKAETMYKIVADRDNPIALNALAYRWAQQNNNLDEAEKLINRAITLNSEASYVSNYLDTYGLILYKQGKYEDAIKQFEKAVEISPNNVSIHNHLGDCYIKINNSNKAKEQWLKALVLKPLISDDKLKDEIKAKIEALH